MRGKGRRPWIKLHTSFLESSVNMTLSPSEQVVFVKLILLAACCTDDGWVCDNNKKPLSRNFIAHRLFVDTTLLESTITKCKEMECLAENGSGLQIVNWKSYQDEYTRQKPYREKKKQEEQDPDRYTKGKYGHLVKR